MTMNYETPFHSEIGSNVTNSLFDNISPLTAIVIQKSIQSVINNFEPRVNLLGVNVVVSPDTNGYTATIVYRLINRTDPTTITLFLQKTR
jgi:phage baseplate assembly protein W